jgi:hypothetical protein
MILAALALAATLTAPVEILQGPVAPPANAPNCAEAQQALKALNDLRPNAAAGGPRYQVSCQNGKAVRILRFPGLDGFGAEKENIYRPAVGCEDIQRRIAEHQRETLKKLDRLPPAYREYAVLRQLGGCPVPAPVGYHPPALPGAADYPPQ